MDSQLSFWLLRLRERLVELERVEDDKEARKLMEKLHVAIDKCEMLVEAILVRYKERIEKNV